KIAVAHHKDDQAETVLFHLFRGSGLKGLGGMKPVRGDIIRPLLCLERSEIESFLQEREQTYRTDATNEETTYTRNIIRHEVIAVAKAQIQEQVVAHIADTATRMQQAEQFVEQYAKKEYGNVVTVQEDVYRIHVKALSDIDPFIQTYIIRMCMEQLAEEWKDIAAGHVKDVLDLAAKDVGKSISLPQNMTARRDYEDILIYKKDVDTDKVTVCENVTVPGTIYLENGVCIDFQVEPCENKGEIVQKKYTKWFDYDKIESDLLLRNRKTNDFMCINSNMDRQTIKTYCINEKIPKEERDQLLLLADGSHILWLIGYRISEQYKVTKETKNILKVRVYGGTCDE
ncbi:MAG TPA: tRNA lysidine(34) synthetase TilS, partial [Lachnospiraceae bacterium]|nr:tRNA lysidine(34) synthetase TilS [Lachnospiraceae bacterium]